MNKFSVRYNFSSLNKAFAKKVLYKTLAICTLSILSLHQSVSADPNNSSKDISIDTSAITLSGLSAGGFMANQYHLSHPDQVTGVGIIAAGPFGCARNSIMTALSECVNKAPDKYPLSISNISDQFKNESKTLKDDKVWLLHGTLDTRIVAKVADALHHQYSQIIQAENLKYINDKPFSHLFPTLNTGVKCDTSESPFIGNCGYDAAGELLTYIIGSLNPKANTEEVNKLGQLLKFEQEKLTDLSGTGMHKYAYAFVPTSCSESSANKACRLHISFHGCNQSIDNVNDQYARNTGINEWAATNGIVVLYPQVAKSTLMPMNPQACWDWWGYSDENYGNKNGKQITAVHEIILGLADYLNN